METKATKANTRASAFALVNAERERQIEKWGEENFPPQFWAGVLGEEYGELCEAINETVFNNGPAERAKGGYDNMPTEASHVAAVAISFIEYLERNKAIWRPYHEKKET
jgi:NTP pyrophosphatase (non-canonical NTP hydrolase)